MGAQARGERIEAVVGGGLTLQSLQDVDVYRRDVRQSGASAGYTFGAGGPSGSASANRSRIDSDYLSVREQSGLFAGAGGFGLEVAGHTELTGAVIASAAAPDQNRLATGTLGYGNLANRAEYESSSSGGAIGFGPGSLPIPTPVLGVSGGDEAASLTLAAMAPGAIAIRNPANQTQALSALSRDPEASHRALAAIFDPREAAERQELAQGFGQEAFRAVGDIASIFTRPYEKAQSDEAIARDYLALKAKGELTEEERALVAIYELRGALTPEKAAQQIEDALRRQALTQADYDAWKEGSLNKTLLHGLVGALQASFGGADALSGALGAGAAEASRTLTEQLPKELQQWASAVVGAAAGAMAGGGSAGIQTGAATAWSGEVYNRQLHPKESAWIEQNAKAFAKDQGISEEEARTRLALQAAKDVDFLWRSGLAPGDDDAARVFLAKADETFLNERGNAQRLFTTELGQYFAFQQGVFDADRQFYRSYLTPNVTRDIATGAREEAKRMGLDAWGAVRSDPLGVAGALASGLYEAGVAMVLDPQSAIVGAYDRFMASGQDIGTGFGAALDPALRDPLNALYGQDVSGAVAIATAANAAATVGTVFGTGKLASLASDLAAQTAKRGAITTASGNGSAKIEAGSPSTEGSSRALREATDLSPAEKQSLELAGLADSEAGLSLTVTRDLDGKIRHDLLPDGAGTALLLEKRLKEQTRPWVQDELAAKISALPASLRQEVAAVSVFKDGQRHSAEVVNAFLDLTTGMKAPYMLGTDVYDVMLRPGQKIYVIENAIQEGPGGWAAPRIYTDLNQARSELGLIPEFKNLKYDEKTGELSDLVIREYTVTKPLPTRQGIAGPQEEFFKDASGAEFGTGQVFSGGGRQVEILIDVRKDTKDASTGLPNWQSYLSPDAQYGLGDRYFTPSPVKRH